MITSEIAEPRYILAKAKAKEIWENLGGKKIPVQINDIVKALGIPVSERDLEVYGTACMHEDGIFYIAFKKICLLKENVLQWHMKSDI